MAWGWPYDTSRWTDLHTLSSLQRFFTFEKTNQNIKNHSELSAGMGRFAKLLWNVDVVNWGIMSYSLSCEQGWKKERGNAGHTSRIRTRGFSHKGSARLGVTCMTCTPSISKPRSQWKTLVPHLGVSVAKVQILRDSIPKSHSPPGSSYGRISISFCPVWSHSASNERRVGTFEVSNVEAPWMSAREKLRWHDSTQTEHLFRPWQEYARMRGLTHFHNTAKTSCRTIKQNSGRPGFLRSTWHNSYKTFSLRKVQSLVDISKGIYNAKHKWTQTD